MKCVPAFTPRLLLPLTSHLNGMHNETYHENNCQSFPKWVQNFMSSKKTFHWGSACRRVKNVCAWQTEHSKGQFYLVWYWKQIKTRQTMALWNIWTAEGEEEDNGWPIEEISEKHLYISIREGWSMENDSELPRCCRNIQHMLCSFCLNCAYRPCTHLVTHQELLLKKISHSSELLQQSDARKGLYQLLQA